MKIKVLIISAFLTATSVILPHAPKIIPGGNPLIAAAPIVVVLSIPSKCEGSIKDQLCSAVTGFLDDEVAKTGAAVKGCKDKCGWKKRKDDLVKAAQKKAKDSCAKGNAPDINEVNKGLDTDAKTRLKNLYDRNSRMFDGTAKLAAKDLEPVPSNQPAELTGKGGQVSDLKGSAPDLYKLSPVTEFSL
ncbi:MAG: hypothetical protein KKH28_09575, partial [Elusimicrobia bacterium]|nr:hypothetical protein [Elusimicrobiota bacterium]